MTYDKIQDPYCRSLFRLFKRHKHPKSMDLLRITHLLEQKTTTVYLLSNDINPSRLS